MLKLYLLRHGKAANPEGYTADYDRPLNKKGILQINQIGYRLKKGELDIQQIISSSAIRTVETTKIVNHYLNIQQVEYNKELYLAGEVTILDFIVKNASVNTVLYVGHNFGISDITTYLLDDNYELATGQLMEIEFDVDDWNSIIKGSGRIISVYIPDVYQP